MKFRLNAKIAEHEQKYENIIKQENINIKIW